MSAIKVLYIIIIIIIINSRFVMTEEDHRVISEMLPVLIAAAMAESKRANQEEKEKHEKIAKIQAADLKDKTVILLRDVLMEMGVSFKSSEPEQGKSN